MKHSLLVVSLLAACDDDNGVNRLDDAPTVDGALDLAVTVTIRAGHFPATDKTVFFQGPDGAELARAQTDANGRASAIVPAGSSVTALDVHAVRDGRSVVTVMGVKPGDDLMLSGDEGLSTAPVAFVYPAYTGVANPSYQVMTTCGTDSGGSGTMPSLQLEQCSPRIDTVVYAGDGLGGEPAYMAKLDQPANATIDLGSATWSEQPALTTTYTNIPTDRLRYTSRRIVTPRGPLAVGCSASGTLSGSTFTAQLQCPVIAGTTVHDHTEWSDIGTQHQYTAMHLLATDSPILDFADVLVKAPNETTLDERTVTWTQTSTGADPDFVVLRIESGTIEWRVMAPYGGTTVEIPPPLWENADLGTNPFVIIETGTTTGGYDAIRPFGPDFMDSITTELARVIMARVYDG